MASNLAVYTVSELQARGALLVEDGNHGEYRPRPSEFTDSGVAFIRAADMDAGQVLFNSAEKINERAVARIRKGVGRPGDVLLSHKGTVGKVAMAPLNAPQFVCSPQTTFWRVTDHSVIDRAYLFAYLRSPDFRSQLATRKGETDMADYVSLTAQRQLVLPLPPIEKQRSISAVLQSLDDRIDHNRTLAANLEAIARALFKSWFVDFDPVRAKAAGEAPPGLAPNLAALFPDRFVDSELGEIPEGWKFVPLSQLVEVERGLSYKGAGLTDRESGKPMHNLNSVLEGGGYKYTGIKFYSGEYKPRHIARSGDIVVANTEQGHKHLLIGFPAIIPESHEEGLFSHHLYRVRLLEGAGATKHWLYYALMAPEVREQIIGHANGSTVNMLKPSGLQVPLVVLPPIALCEQFDALAGSIRARIENCVAESTALAELRDLLLPRLISGKLRVEDAEAALEAA